MFSSLSLLGAIFLSLVILVGLGLLWLASLITLLIGWRTKRPILKWLGGVPFAGLTSIALLLGAWITWSMIRDPESDYNSSFHAMPSADVTGLESVCHDHWDSTNSHLRFQADRATFDRLRPATLKPVPHADRLAQLPGDYPWPAPPPSAACYAFTWETGETHEQILMAFDPATRTVHYTFTGR